MPTESEPIVPVVFRMDPPSEGGECFALFPTLPSSYDGSFCTCYQHHGQHSGADYDACISKSRPASEPEYRSLMRELEGRGYRMVVIQRAVPALHARRRTEAARIRSIKPEGAAK